MRMEEGEEIRGRERGEGGYVGDRKREGVIKRGCKVRQELRLPHKAIREGYAQCAHVPQ